MRKGRDGGKKKREKNGKNGGKKKEKRLMEIVATTSLPAVDHPNADRWNAARSRLFPEWQHYLSNPLTDKVQIRNLG